MANVAGTRRLNNATICSTHSLDSSTGIKWCSSRSLRSKGWRSEIDAQSPSKIAEAWDESDDDTSGEGYHVPVVFAIVAIYGVLIVLCYST